MKLQWSKKYIAMGLVAFLVVAASILFLLFLLKIDVVLSTMSKIFSILMSGFLVWLLAVITVLLVNFVIFYPMEVKGNIPKDLLTEFLMKALRMSILGGIISTLGGICGTLCQSAYMAYGIPFISYYFGIILHQRYFKEQLWFYPPEWITPSGNWGPYQTGLWLFLLLFLLVLIPVLGSVLYDKIEEI